MNKSPEKGQLQPIAEDLLNWTLTNLRPSATPTMVVAGWSFSPNPANACGQQVGSTFGRSTESQQSTQPPEGSETLRCASAVGPAGAPSDREEGVPTGTTGIFCGVVAGRLRYRSLHYAAAMESSREIECFRQSIPIRGVAA